MTTALSAKIEPAIYRDLSPAQLAEEAVRRGEGILASNGALVVSTGRRTGRSPVDRFIVEEPSTADAIHWGAINRPFNADDFDALWERVESYLADKDQFVSHLHVGADPEHYIPTRVTTETAWHNLFGRNLFIQPGKYNPKGKGEWQIINAANFVCDPKRDGTNSDGTVIIHFAQRKVLLAGMKYAGEMKKAMFAVQNFLLPEKDVLPMHCAANMGDDQSVTLFFGLSGTGKTTLSMDPDRAFLGDDEHGWSADGIYNFEGGCYAKTIRLSAQDEPLIYAATERHGTTVANVAWDPLTRHINYDDGGYTENGRASFSIEAIPNAIPSGQAGHPECIIFLTADAFGVLPPVARLSPEQAAYHYSLGYTAKVAGTERGVKEPEPVFSALYGEPFFPRSHATYIQLFMDKLRQHRVPVWLVNTGWTGGKYGVGKRIDIPVTRAIIRAIQSGELNQVSFRTNPVFGFEVPTQCPGVPASILDPASTWQEPAAYEREQGALARFFIDRAAKLRLPAEVLAQNPEI